MALVVLSPHAHALLRDLCMTAASAHGVPLLCIVGSSLAVLCVDILWSAVTASSSAAGVNFYGA